MQIVGSQCHVCGERIVVKIEGAHCPECDIVFHTECAVDEVKCPKCQRNFKELTARRQAEERAGTEAEDSRGRRLVLACILVLMVPNALLLGASIWAAFVLSTFEFPVFVGVSFPIACLVSVALYLGISWARTWVLISLAIGAVVSAVNATAAGVSDSFVFGWGLAWAAIYTGVFLVLAFAPSVSSFFARRG